MQEKDTRILKGSEIIAPEIDTSLRTSEPLAPLTIPRPEESTTQIDPKLLSAQEAFMEILQDRTRLEKYNAYEQAKYVISEANSIAMSPTRFSTADLVTEQAKQDILDLVPGLVTHVETHLRALENLKRSFDIPADDLKPYIEIGVLAPKRTDGYLSAEAIARVAEAAGMQQDLPELLAKMRKTLLAEGHPSSALGIARYQSQKDGALREIDIDPLREEQLLMNALKNPWTINEVKSIALHMSYLGLDVDVERVLEKVEVSMQAALDQVDDRFKIAALDSYARGIGTLRFEHELSADSFEVVSQKLKQTVSELFTSQADSFTDRFSAQRAMISVNNIANALKWSPNDVIPFLEEGIQRSPLENSDKKDLESTLGIIHKMLVARQAE